MFCSTVIPTIGRSTLERAVCSVLKQESSASFEIIVVNDSGRELATAEWQRDARIRVIETKRRGACVARNAGASIARGDLIHFLDDDDWLPRTSYQALRSLSAAYPGAVLLFGGAQFVDGSGRVLGELNLGRTGNAAAQLVGGAWIPPAAFMVQSQAFFRVGGFNPLISSSTEVDLYRRISLLGDCASASGLVAFVLRGEGWATSSEYDKAVTNNRLSREIVLGEEGAFSRLRASADSSYWQGRILHTYVASAKWNLRRRRILSATSRALYSLAWCLLGWRYLFSDEYWRAVRDSQVPCSQDRALGQGQVAR